MPLVADPYRIEPTASETIWRAIVGILTQIEHPKILFLPNPLSMPIGEVHAGATGPVIVFLVGPIVVSAAQIISGRIIRIQHQQNIGGTGSRA